MRHLKWGYAYMGNRCETKGPLPDVPHRSYWLCTFVAALYMALPLASKEFSIRQPGHESWTENTRMSKLEEALKAATTPAPNNRPFSAIPRLGWGKIWSMLYLRRRGRVATIHVVLLQLEMPLTVCQVGISKCFNWLSNQKGLPS